MDTRLDSAPWESRPDDRSAVRSPLQGRGAAPRSDARRDIGARLFRFHRSSRPGRDGRNLHDAGRLHPQRAPSPRRRPCAARQAGAVRVRDVGRRAPSNGDEIVDRRDIERFGEGAAREDRDARRRGIGVTPRPRRERRNRPARAHDRGRGDLRSPPHHLEPEEVRQDRRWGRRGAKPQAPGANATTGTAGGALPPVPTACRSAGTARDVDACSSVGRAPEAPPRPLVRTRGPQAEDHLIRWPRVRLPPGIPPPFRRTRWMQRDVDARSSAWWSAGLSSRSLVRLTAGRRWRINGSRWSRVRIPPGIPSRKWTSREGGQDAAPIRGRAARARLS